MLIEESIIGWKEYEMEVMRDMDDNVVIICSIENFDPMGVHTGDSITVAPGQTLDRQRISADARRLAGRDPRDRRRDGRLEHPVRDPSAGRADDRHRDEPARVAQLGAGSKATGFPIAKIAAKLAVGYRCTSCPTTSPAKTTACFEPTIDYVVSKSRGLPSRNFPRPTPR